MKPFLPLQLTALALVLFAPNIAGAGPLKLSTSLTMVPLSARSAGDTSPNPAILTLDTALGFALVKDLRYASALAAFRAAQEQIPQAQAGFRPQLALTGAVGASSGRSNSGTRSQELVENRSESVLATQSETQTQTQTVTQQNGLPSANTDSRSSSTNSSQSTFNEQVLENLDTNSRQTSSQNAGGWTANTELSLRWTVFRPGLERQLELSQIRVAQAEVQLQAARQDVVLRLTKAYFDLMLSNEELRAIDSQKTAVQAQLNVAEQSFKEGETTIADVKEAQAKWDIVRALEVAQRNTLQIRQTTLQALIGQRGKQVQSLKVNDLLAVPPELGALTDWVDRAEKKSHPVLFEVLGQAAAEKEVARQNAAFKPSVDFVASLGTGRKLQRSRTESASATSENAQRTEPSQSTVESQTSSESVRGVDVASGTNQVSSSSTAQSSSSETVQSSSYRPASTSRSLSSQLDAYVGVRLNIPLFDGGFTNSKVREAMALQDQKSLDVQRVKAEAALAAETAFLEAQGFFAEAGALKAAERSGEVALKSNEMGYQAGVRINSDILNAQQQLFNVRRDLIKTQVSALLATLRLKATAGALAEEDVA
ncbi:MAG: TolC family protein, partial [Hydrogenophaga sp.]